MVSIQGALFHYLTNNTGVKALVKSRVYPAGDVPSSATLPYVVYQKLGDEHQITQCAASNVAAARFQIDGYAASALTADAVYNALRAALDGYYGEMGATGATVHVERIFLESDNADFIPPSDASERGPHRVSLDVTVWHAE